MTKLTFITKALAKRSKSTSIFLTEKEAAKWIGRSVFTLARMRKRGEIGFAKIGNSVRYTVEDLETYIQSVSKLPCQQTVSKSENTISPSTKAPPFGKPLGTTPIPDKQSAYLLAQKTFKTPRSA